jgi:ATP-dependent RNA helicase DeaD
MTFAEFSLSPDILRALDEMGYKEPSAIQTKTIPLILKNKDLIALAKTGSGKTAACAIPVCERVDTHKVHVQALIVVPTRELALQYAHEAQKIGKRRGVKAFALCGGEDYSLQHAKLKAGVQVLVATPGRLIDFIYSRSIDLSNVEILILDEADEMLSMGFVDDLEFIINCLVHPHQTLLFSATMPKGIRGLALKHLKDPTEILLTSEEVTPQKIDHYFLFCRHDARDQELVRAIHEQKPKQAIVFCHSRIQAEKVASMLRKNMKDVDLLHAGFPQEIRTIVTSKFRQKKIRILVATDVVARGLDFSSVSHVFIYELSHDPDIYIHRSGRTGRFDREGVVITLVTKRELGVVDRIRRKIGQELKWIVPPPPQAPRSTPPRRGGGMRRRPPSSTG